MKMSAVGGKSVLLALFAVLLHERLWQAIINQVLRLLHKIYILHTLEFLYSTADACKS